MSLKRKPIQQVVEPDINKLTQDLGKLTLDYNNKPKWLVHNLFDKSYHFMGAEENPETIAQIDHSIHYDGPTPASIIDTNWHPCYDDMVCFYCPVLQTNRNNTNMLLDLSGHDNDMTLMGNFSWYHNYIMFSQSNGGSGGVTSLNNSINFKDHTIILVYASRSYYPSNYGLYFSNSILPGTMSYAYEKAVWNGSTLQNIQCQSLNNDTIIPLNMTTNNSNLTTRIMNVCIYPHYRDEYELNTLNDFNSSGLPINDDTNLWYIDKIGLNYNTYEEYYDPFSGDPEPAAVDQNSPSINKLYALIVYDKIIPMPHVRLIMKWLNLNITLS